MASISRPCGPAPPAAIYSDIATGFAACQAHAKANGYALKQQDTKPFRALFVCDRAGKYDSRGKQKDVHSSKRRQNTGSKKCGCLMRLTLAKDRVSGEWQVKVLEATHNHAASADSTAHPAHRIASTSAEIRASVDTLAKAGLSNAQILSTLREEDSSVTLVSKDISNLVAKERAKQLGGKTPIQWLMEELQANDFHPQYYPQSGPLQRLFFIHPTSLELWKQHSDVLLLDCTYKTNRFNMPLLNICGITGNNMVVQLGLAFLSGETQRDYTWAIIQLRSLMLENTIAEPVSIVTDRELALMKCLDTQFPNSRHILCRWHVNMNVLAKTKKYFPGPIKGEDGKWARHPKFQAFLSCWNTLLASTTEQAYDELLEEMRVRFPLQAMSYCEGTWLLWKEKLVAFWVDQSNHFGVTVTSPIEGCHATLKLYLQRGHADLRGVFLKMQLFWTAQHTGIRTAVAQQQLRPRHSTNIPLFAAILQFVHGRALLRIIQENSKLPYEGPPPDSCTCTTQQAFGLPCLHTIYKRKQEGGVILLSDIHPYWYYNRPQSNASPGPLVTPQPLLILNPMKVKGKGRPKGALGGGSRVAPSSTRRDPSFFELPSSSAPASLGQSSTVQNSLSTTALAMKRLELGHRDLYEPGTRRERAYMQGISSVYQTDSIEDATTIAAATMQREVIGGVEVYTQDADFEADDDFDGLA